MKIGDFIRFVRAIQRIRQVSAILAKHGFYQIITNLGLSRFFIFKKYLKAAYPVDNYQNVPPEVRLRYALEELGPTFIKLGQIFSEEIADLPLKYIIELRKLQDSTRIDYNKINDIREIFKAETGLNIEKVFTSFEETPVASASIAQVHKAVLKDGTVVAVKIKKKDVHKIIKKDIGVLYFISSIAGDAAKELLYIDNAEEFLEEFVKNITSELDFLREAGNTEKVRKINQDKDTVEIAKVYWEYSSANVLVEDFIEGVKISDVNELSKRGFDKNNILKIFLNHFLNQIFIVGYFNADPHPGNILVINENKIGIIDFGSVGIITKDLRKKVLRYFIDFFHDDYEDAASLFIDICMGNLTEREEQAFKFELIEFIESVDNKPFKDIYSSEILLETLKIGHNHKLAIPSELSLLFKAMLPIESVAKMLNPNFSFADSGLEFFNSISADKKAKAKAKDIEAMLIDNLKSYKNFFEVLPKRADKILKKMSEDKFSIDFIHKGLEGLIGEMERSSKRLTGGLLLASVIISSGVLIFIGSEFSHLYISIMGITGWIMGLLYILILLFK
ncbi:ABC1 kinase family protein [Candidatus Acidulodesulfobacterium sp. H_13]|uniref:ABC1 kinase family protein n=1 Tax=Candidatus Acidulodesulfobacterium sp. H_13 TaxID=3395470 RepID=UPI003AF60DB9